MNMTFLSKISVKHKLLLIVCIPIVATIFLAGIQILHFHTVFVQQTKLSEIIHISVATGDLVHELQKERGNSAGYLGSHGKIFADVLPKQHLATDEKINALTQVLASVRMDDYGTPYNETIREAQKELDKIKEIRTKVLALALPVPDAVAYYTNMNTDFLGVTTASLHVVEDPETLRQISAYLYLMQSKERAGIERAVGATGFGGGWNPALITKFKNLIAIQDTYMAVALSYATEEEKNFLETQLKSPAVADVQKLRDIAIDMAANPAYSGDGVDAETWFKTATTKINILKDIESHVAKNIITLAEKNAEMAKAERNLYISLLSLMVSVIMILTYVTLKDFLSNIHYVQNVMGRLSDGDDSVNIIGIERQDEIGDMLKSIAVFKQGLIERKHMERENLSAQTRAEDEKRRMMIDLADSFDSHVGGMISALAAASTELQSTAESMRAIADETAKSSASVAMSTNQANANIASVSSAMQEMSSTSNEIAMQVSSVRQKSNDTARNAEKANTTVSNLNDLVENIGVVVVAIKGIAEQTNLLALNATIEAARAGESGKGFAVVADEVKKLASETARKTEEIENRINEIQHATQESVQSMHHIIENIAEIDGSVTDVATAVEEQNITNAGIVGSISEASHGVQHVEHVILEVQQGANETGSSADAVLEASREVAKLSENLNSSVNRFLNQIRSNAVKK